MYPSIFLVLFPYKRYFPRKENLHFITKIFYKYMGNNNIINNIIVLPTLFNTSYTFY